jgi:cellulose synthase/poly-beta-1,6-N-acetylglucosamine synthase-like glycosyltransferase
MDNYFLPSVTVIIPIYNGESDLPDLLNCLEQQNYDRTLVEYLLVDNNSSDRTLNILRSAAEVAKKNNLNLRYLTEKIQSSYAARNLGIRNSSYDILAFTDADCRPQSDWLLNSIKPLIDPQVGIVVGEIIALHGNSLLEQYAKRNQLMSQHFLLKHPFGAYGQTANIVIRKQAFIDSGLFRPYLTTGGDADICWRIQQQGWKLEYAPDAIISHRHRATLNNFRSQFRRYGRSNYYLHQLHGVDLMRELTSKEIVYRLSRWLLKELPRDTLKAIARQASFVDLVNTPIDLIGFSARTTGQKTATLTEAAKQIEWL